MRCLGYRSICTYDLIFVHFQPISEKIHPGLISVVEISSIFWELGARWNWWKIGNCKRQLQGIAAVQEDLKDLRLLDLIGAHKSDVRRSWNETGES